MSRDRRSWPILRKFRVATLTLSLPPIILLSIFFIATEYRSVREQALENGEALIGMIARNAAVSVAFDDPDDARAILADSTADNAAEVAALYDAQGNLYAWYPTNLPASSFPARPVAAPFGVASARLELIRAMTYQGRRPGTAYLRLNLSSLHRRFFGYALAVAAVSLASVLFTLFAARLIRRTILDPLLELSATADAVVAKNDLSLRAEKRSSDEVGRLVDRFNAMLSDIEQSQKRAQTELRERQKAEVALRDSREQLQLLANNVPALISYIDTQLKYVLCNKSYETWFGVAQSEIVGRSVRDVLGDDAWQTVKPHMESALAGTHVEFETRAKYKTGPARWIHASYTPHRDAEGRVVGFIVQVIDITARKHVESFTGFKSALGQDIALLGTSPEIIGRANERLGEFLGVDRCCFCEFLDDLSQFVIENDWHSPGRGSIAGTHDFSAFSGQTHMDELMAAPIVVDDVSTHPAAAELKPQFDKIQVAAFVTVPLLRENRHLVVMVVATSTPRKWTPEEVALVEGVAGRAWPTAERARAQAQLREHAAELENTVLQRTSRLRQTVEELEAFSYSIAHDMRAPLRSMRGFSGILLAEHAAKLDPAGKDYLRRISASAERLDAMITDVLSYSRVVRGDLPLEPVDVSRLVAEIVESYPNLQRPVADILVQEPLPKLIANRAAMTQVISNLLGNGVKFVAPGVKPSVRVRAEPAIASGDHFVRLWFEDNGIGIDAESTRRLFQMFYRAHAGREYDGTGMGLAIVRKAVERMGGRVGVESELTRGSRFWVELKAAEQN